MMSLTGINRSRQRNTYDNSESSWFRSRQGYTRKIDEVRELLNHDPDAIVIKLLSSQFRLTDTFQESKDEMTDVLLRVIKKACKTVGSPQNLIYILQKVNSSGFMTGPVIQYITKCRIGLAAYVNYDVLLTICHVLKACQDRIPATSFENVMAVLAQLRSVEASSEKVRSTNELRECLDEIEEQHTTVLRQIQGGSLMKAQNRNVDSENYSEPPDNFRQIPIGPTPQDLHDDIGPFLRKNRITSSYRDTEQYLDIQFRLLREDYLYPLRQGIRELRRAGKEHADERYIQDVQIYSDVKCVGSWYSEKGVVYRLMFDMLQFKHIKWEYSKRLMYGSLVCLSLDDFTSFMFGIVVERDSELLSNGQVNILIYDVQQYVNLNRFITYKMVECSAYFEAYRYNLESLQELDDTKLPFLDYLLGHRQSAASPPRYLQGSNAEYDFKPILRIPSSSTKWAVLDKAKWLKANDMGLDQSQFKALQMALTHEFSLIQGPPGTGKTFIALKIVELLLHNFHAWGRRLRREDRELKISPILLVCYTNHALDQFLEGILNSIHDDDCGSVVRVGGRCHTDNERLLRCQLSKLKHDPAARSKIPGEVKDAKGAILDQMESYERYLSDIGRERASSFTKVIDDVYILPMMRKRHRMCFEALIQAGNRSVIIYWLLCSVNVNNPSVNECWDDGMNGGRNVPLRDHTEKNVDAQMEQITEEEMDQIQQEWVIDENVEDTKSKRLGHISKCVLDQSLSFSDAPTKNIPGQWRTVVSNKRVRKLLRAEMNRPEFMSDEEESNVSDVWQLPAGKRWNLYRLWRRRFDADCSYRMQEHIMHYNQLAQRLAELREEENYHMLKNTKVIAMTTTGAAKYRHVLRRVKPSIVIVEEAAEVLEAHIITSLSEFCEHLILIGDHQQLRPKPTVYKLAKKYNLDISLFERMLLNNLPSVQLEIQHRMRPEIAKLIVPHIYPHLLNAKSVEEYDNVRGIGGNVFFVDHNHTELHTVDTKSRRNIHEAEYLGALCRYLILQGYQQSEVTILTTYTGQMFEIKKRIRSDKVISSVRVTSVDNFQGEENDIILLSLVRSNDQGRAGFLKIANRICVALSRAKKGLFVIGDMQLMQESSPVWKDICSELMSKNKIVDGIPLFCQNHPETSFYATNIEDFTKAPDGGCTRPCEYRLKCGHVCGMSCHPTDPEHKAYKCTKPCQKIVCTLGHRCQRGCFEDCGKCVVLVEKTIPSCQHKLNIPCHMNAAKYECTKPCEKIMDCGHRCPNRCGETCLEYTKCKVTIFDKMLPCGHQLNVECCNNNDSYPCPIMVEQSLPCGHSATVKCSADISKISCMKEIQMVLCERRCQNTVTCCLKDKVAEEGCQAMLEKICEKNAEHVYRVKCSEYETSNCSFPCNTKLPCGHTCQGKCGACWKLARHERCEAACRRKLPCQHICRGICGDPCPPCREHCKRSCPHGICRNMCSKPCKCTDTCVRRCSHSQCTLSCSAVCSEEPCGQACPLRLPCGHSCPCYCGEPCATICPTCSSPFYEQVHKKLDIPMDKHSRYVVLLPCRHAIPAQYMDQTAREYSNHLRHVPREFKLFQCPFCGERITHCPKYQRLVVSCHEELEKVNGAVHNNWKTWKSLFNSDIGKELHNEIRRLSEAGQDGLCHALRTCLGCVGLLGEVREYMTKIEHTREKKVAQNTIDILKNTLKDSNRDLVHYLADYSNRRREIDVLSLKIQLLFMGAILAHMLTYVRNYRKQNVIQMLLDTVKRTIHFKSKSKARAVISRANIMLCDTIPKPLRNWIEDYEIEINSYFTYYVDLLVEKKWIICRMGHVFSVAPATDVQTLDDNCPLCTSKPEPFFSEDEDDSSDEDSPQRMFGLTLGRWGRAAGLIRRPIHHDIMF